MVEVKQLSINNIRFVHVVIHLPKISTQLIYCTKGILFDQYWSIEELHKHENALVCIGSGKTVEELMSNTVDYISLSAQAIGIEKSMQGKDALLKMFNEN